MNTQRSASEYQTATNIDGLSTSELFALMVVRLWVRVNADHPEPGAQWWEGFLAVGLDRQTAAAFDIFMQILFYAARPPLDIGARNYKRLQKDEALLLRFISSLQHHQYARALEILEGWLPEEEVSLAWEPSMQFVAGLTAVKLIVPLCEEDMVTMSFRTLCAGHRVDAKTQPRQEAREWVH